MAMEPTELRVAVMDSARPGLVATLPVQRLSQGARAGRGALRLLLVGGVGVALIFVPLVHLCGAAIAFIGAPIAAFFAWKASALIGEGTFPCPKCEQSLKTPPRLSGWPARVHCDKCGAMVELKPTAA